MLSSKAGKMFSGASRFLPQLVNTLISSQSGTAHQAFNIAATALEQVSSNTTADGNPLVAAGLFVITTIAGLAYLSSQQQQPTIKDTAKEVKTVSPLLPEETIKISTNSITDSAAAATAAAPSYSFSSLSLTIGAPPRGLSYTLPFLHSLLSDETTMNVLSFESINPTEGVMVTTQKFYSQKEMEKFRRYFLQYLKNLAARLLLSQETAKTSAIHSSATIEELPSDDSITSTPTKAKKKTAQLLTPLRLNTLTPTKKPKPTIQTQPETASPIPTPTTPKISLVIAELKKLLEKSTTQEYDVAGATSNPDEQEVVIKHPAGSKASNKEIIRLDITSHEVVLTEPTNDEAENARLMIAAVIASHVGEDLRKIKITLLNDFSEMLVEAIKQEAIKQGIPADSSHIVVSTIAMTPSKKTAGYSPSTRIFNGPDDKTTLFSDATQSNKRSSFSEQDLQPISRNLFGSDNTAG